MAEFDLDTRIAELVDVLTDEPVGTPLEVFRRCEAADRLSNIGPAATEALPALLRTLVVPASTDCVLYLRVAAASAVWNVGARADLALPFLAWALNDEYWGVSWRAVKVLGDMGPVAHDAVPSIGQLAQRRLDHGPFDYEKSSDCDDRTLLTDIAATLGRCGQGLAYRGVARTMIERIIDCEDSQAQAVARKALIQLAEIERM